MSKGSREKRLAIQGAAPRTVEVDSLEPDYDGKCYSCEGSPTVVAYQYGRPFHEFGLCGVCMFGEARMINPREWNE